MKKLARWVKAELVAAKEKLRRAFFPKPAPEVPDEDLALMKSLGVAASIFTCVLVGTVGYLIYCAIAGV